MVVVLLSFFFRRPQSARILQYGAKYAPDLRAYYSTVRDTRDRRNTRDPEGPRLFLFRLYYAKYKSALCFSHPLQKNGGPQSGFVGQNLVPWVIAFLNP